jgi:hypothetical protein
LYLISTYSVSNTVSGKVSGITEAGSVIAESNGKQYTGTLNADGTYTIDLFTGEYDFEFIAGNKVAYALNKQVSGATTVDATAFDGTYRIADSITLNGNTYRATKQDGVILTSTVAERAAYAENNEVHTSAYNVAMPNTTVKGNQAYTYELKIAGGTGASGDFEWRSYGLGITNGANAFMVTIRHSYGFLYVDLNYKNSDGTHTPLYTIQSDVKDGMYGWDATKDSADTTFKFVKTADSLLIYRKGNNNADNIHTDYRIMYEIMADGTVKNASGEALTLKSTPDSWNAFVASLFDASKDHAIMLASADIIGGFSPKFGLYLTANYSKNN